MVSKFTVNSKPKKADIEVLDDTGTKISHGEKTPHTYDFTTAGKYNVKVTISEDGQVFSKTKEVEVEADKPKKVDITIITPNIKKKIQYIGLYTFVFTAVLIIIAIWTHLNHINYILPQDHLWEQIVFVACAGGIGALAFSMYVLTYHVGRLEDFDPDYAISYYIRPFLGIIYGTFVYFLISGGVMILSTQSNAEHNIIFYIALAFVAGYAEEPFSLQLKDLAEAIFKKPTDDSNK